MSVRATRRSLKAAAAAVAGAYLLCALPRPAHATPVGCADAASLAEHALLLPEGLLRSIGRVETGNLPWSVNIDGAGYSFTSADRAVQFLRSGRISRRHYVDVGCFQVDLLYHPDAFDSLESAFDPVSNAMAAGRFLLSLQRTSRSWFDAVARYHSSFPMRGASYADVVFATLNGTSGVMMPKRYMSRQATAMFGMHITVPGASPAFDRIPFRVAGLPVVQTP